MNEAYKQLIGKTIANVAFKKYDGYDDEPLFEIEFTDGTFVYIEATYGGYTGDSIDEYPAFITVSDIESAKKESGNAGWGNKFIVGVEDDN